ncbi:MAG TPA: hypothetical protein VGC98_15975 [Thermoleophilaceae bacterium]|jgi:hypothetical protein
MAQRRIRATKLATKLAEALSGVVPAEMEVSVAGAVVSLGERGMRAGMEADLRPAPDPPEPTVFDLSPEQQAEFGVVIHEDASSGVRSAVAVTDSDKWRAAFPAPPPRAAFLEIADVAWTLDAILDQFQDEVAETIAEPWPAVSPGPMPETFVELRDDRLVAGYGDPADPVVTLLSVPLQDLR